MKTLKDLIKENINEAAAEPISIDLLYQMLLDPKDRDYITPEDLLDFRWSEDMIDYFKKHCCIVPALGGWNGNPEDDWIEENGWREEDIDKLVNQISLKASDTKVKKILNVDIVKSYLKKGSSRFEPKLVGFRYISGFTCPSIICFDEDTPMAKEICDLAEEFM